VNVFWTQCRIFWLHFSRRHS